MKETLVVNLIGGPCSGKSTISSGLFHKLKTQDIDCELALEFAKDKVWEESFRTMDDQIYIFGKQYHRIWRLNGKVDVIITDSPLLISIYCMKEPSKYFNNLVLEQYHKFNNLMYFIERGDSYQTNGRIQSLGDAMKIDSELKNILIENNISWTSLPQEEAIDIIFNEIIEKL